MGSVLWVTESVQTYEFQTFKVLENRNKFPTATKNDNYNKSPQNKEHRVPRVLKCPVAWKPDCPNALWVPECLSAQVPKYLNFPIAQVPFEFPSASSALWVTFECPWIDLRVPLHFLKCVQIRSFLWSILGHISHSVRVFLEFPLSALSVNPSLQHYKKWNR